MHLQAVAARNRAPPLAQDVAPGDSTDAYAQLLAAAVLPRVAAALTNAWEPRDPEPALRWLDAWEPLLPPAVQRHVLHSLVFPKVTANPTLILSIANPTLTLPKVTGLVCTSVSLYAAPVSTIRYAVRCCQPPCSAGICLSFLG